MTVVGGAVLGVLVTISSVGAGAIGVTVLIILYPRLPTQNIIGSDIAHSVPLTLLAGIGHWLLGSVDWLLLAVIATASAQQSLHFDGSSWWSHVKFFADDSLEGRDTGSEGLRKAEAYAVEQFEKSGLEPGGASRPAGRGRRGLGGCRRSCPW